MAECLAPSMLNVLPSSRAGSLLQGIAVHFPGMKKPRHHWRGFFASGVFRSPCWPRLARCCARCRQG
ncbi:MAG: hypothetical protein C0411_06160 [Pseudomonas sp.]|nr:hypothetical protein [Pseudomonas sp.]